MTVYSFTAMAGGGHDELVTPVLLGLVVLFLAAKAGGVFADQLGQPIVLGELIVGLMLGNLGLVGYTGLEYIGTNETIQILAEIGVVFLLFEVGLESTLKEMMRVGVVSLLVAIMGVVAPFAFGYAVSYFLLPDKSVYVHSFIGATLCATSVGITARVLKDLGKITLKESKIILGAAVIDDVLGLILLATISAIIKGVDGTGHAMSLWAIMGIAFKAIGFLVVVILVGVKVAPKIFKWGATLKVEGVLLTFSLAFCFALSYLSSLVGLAPIVGAFAAGLIIDSKGYADYFVEDESSVEQLIFPISKFFVPIFFVRMGTQVNLELLVDPRVLTLGFTLTIVAILGKQLCGAAVFGKENTNVSRLLVGIGMIPRGEVGLIFAMIGAGLMIGGVRVVDDSIYAAIVLMVMLTTMITPPGLKWALSRKFSHEK